MRSCLIVLSAVLLACGSTQAVNQADPQAAAAHAEATEFLLSKAALDFNNPRAPKPVAFRKVRMSTAAAADGSTQYRLCGEYLAAQKEGGSQEWAAFATIKTSDYEQWLGAQSVSYCKGPGIRSYAADLSAQLQRHLQALK